MTEFEPDITLFYANFLNELNAIERFRELRKLFVELMSMKEHSGEDDVYVNLDLLLEQHTSVFQETD